LYDIGKATEAATHLEIDAVIDPKESRAYLLRAYRACGIL
jgi:acetyl-CoA carboxylase carboxyltransferase component